MSIRSGDRRAGAPALALITLAGAAAPAAAGSIGFTLHFISQQDTGVRSISAGDVDRDGDADFLSAVGNENTVSLYENGGGMPPVFSERVLDTTRRMSDYILAADVDGDSILDIVSNSTVDDEISWYRSDGGAPASFTKYVIDQDPDGNGPLQGFADAVRQIAVGDFDNDGDLDVASVSVDDDTVAWFANPGTPGGAWEPHTLTEALDGARAVHAADLDGDGDDDIAAGGWFGPDLIWFENDGLTPATFTQRTVATFPPGAWPDEVANLWEIDSADLDGDGDRDLVVARLYYGCEWFENDGASPPSFARHVILPLASGGKSVRAADLDHDGDRDVIFASRGEDRISWFENDGAAAPSFTEHVITIDPDGWGPGGGPMQGPADGARSVVAADFDGDGDLDVGWGARDNDSTGWFENDLIDLVPPCPADLDADGSIGVGDLLALLSGWGAPGPADLDGSGAVGLPDLLALLGLWGPCTGETACGAAGAGGCFEAHGGAGCESPACCDRVCAAAPDCCAVAWDESCAALALEACAGCGSPGAGDCCQAGGSPGCNEASCCAGVCAADSFCCETAWDAICAAMAAQSCGCP